MWWGGGMFIIGGPPLIIGGPPPIIGGTPPIGGPLVAFAGGPPDCSWMRRINTESLPAPAPHAPPTIFSCFTSAAEIIADGAEASFSSNLTFLSSLPLLTPSFFLTAFNGPRSTPISNPPSSSSEASSFFTSSSSSSSSSSPSDSFFTLTATRSPCTFGARGTTVTIPGSGNLFCLLASVSSCLTAN